MTQPASSQWSQSSFDSFVSESKPEIPEHPIFRDMPIPGILLDYPTVESEYLSLIGRYPKADPIKLLDIAKRMVIFMSPAKDPSLTLPKVLPKKNGGPMPVRRQKTETLDLSPMTSTFGSIELSKK